MKYKAGDRVKIKSLDWYNENKSELGNISFPYEAKIAFISGMSLFCGKIVTISQKGYTQDVGFYRIREDNGVHLWTDEMIEGLAEEMLDKEMEEHQRMCDEIMAIQGIEPIEAEMEQIIHCPEGYIFKDENGVAINATKIVLEKKKKEYPKTYGECSLINGCKGRIPLKIIGKFTRLINARNAYWRLYGKEIGLEKPWEPDWNAKDNHFYTIHTFNGKIECSATAHRNAVLIFPIAEMRDAFKENFDPDIEFCKELL